MSRWGFLRGGVAYACIILLLALTLVPTPGWAANKISPDPTVTSAGKTIDITHLSAQVPTRLSGLANNVIEVAYSGQGELLVCNGSRLRYTIDGSAPSASSPSLISGTTAGSTCNPPAASTGMTYTWTLTPANFTNAPANALVQFRMEIMRAGTTTQIDDNNGIFYKYRIDRSRGEMVEKVPAPVVNSTLGSRSVTASETPPISFLLEDSDAEAPINETTFAIEVDGVSRTTAFDCDFTSFSVECAMVYARMPANFKFTEGDHTIKAVGSDEANNAFDATKGAIQLRVDRTVPNVRNITGTPNQQGGTSGGLPIVSRGANLTVKANVEDISVNKNSTTAARAVLFNATNTAIPVSEAFSLRFNTTSGKFEGNVTVPLSWPQQAFGVRIRVLGQDQAGNIGQNNTTADVFILDPILPVIVEASPPGPFIRDTPTRITARITDQGSGIDPNQVKILFSNITGDFKSVPSTATRVSGTQNVFEAKMNRIGSTDNYTYDIPAANASTVITYQITAKDKAGGPASTVPRTLTVDITGPTVEEVAPKPFRGAAKPYVFEFEIADAGAGVNVTANKLFYTTSGTFQSANLVRDATSGNYVASISPTVTDGQELKYYVEAKDILGNIGQNGTSTAPKVSRIDLVAPTITKITSPPTASGSTFLVEWDASDSRSGVANFTVEARVNDGTPSRWIPILNGTTDKSIAFCGEGGHTYEFRVAATDVAGNTGLLPANPQTTTSLSGEGCAEQVLVSIISPAAGQIIDAAAGNGTFQVRFSASSTRTFTPSSQLRMDILFSPDGVFFATIESGVLNTGSYFLDVSELPTCSACKVRVVAKTLTGASDDATSGAFTLRNGDTEADLDGNGLPDAWEVLYIGQVGQAKPDEDNDGDGLSNLEESRIGTDPDNRDTDGDGASDRAESRAGTDALSASDTPSLVQSRSDEYTHWYWTIPGLFLATTILFFVGLARRW